MDSQSAAGLPAADWCADPSGRHQFRYWDGVAWTDSVTDDGKQTTDPLSQAPPQTNKTKKANKTKQRLIERTQPLLPPGTQIRQIFTGSTQSPFLLFGLMLFFAVLPGAIIFMLINRNRVIAVTQDAVYVLNLGSFAWSKPKRVLRVLPRTTRFGPVGGIWAKINVGTEHLRVGDNAGAYAEVAAADAEAALLGAPTTSIAVFRADAPSPGAGIVCDGDRLLFGGLEGEPLEWDLVCQYDQGGYLEWASEEWRQWVWQHATLPIALAGAAEPTGVDTMTGLTP